MDILKHKNLTVENWEGFNKIPRWFREAETINAKIKVLPHSGKGNSTENSLILWSSGTWVSGTWKAGIWLDGTWENGAWLGGDWRNGVWKKGTWFDGQWCKGTWLNGNWYKGCWESGLWVNGQVNHKKSLGFNNDGRPIWA